MADINELEEKKPYTPARGTFEKKKPGTVVIDQFGNVERKRRMIGMDISDICMPPLTKKTVATYRVIDADKISLSTGLPAEPITFLLPGTYMFYDRGESDPARANKLMRNLGRPETVIDPTTKKPYIDENLVDFIEFVHGVKRVDVQKEFLLYCFIELHPLNRSNRFRPTNLPALFERVDLQAVKGLAFQTAALDLAWEAENAVIQMRDNNDIMAHCVANNIPVMENGKAREISAMKLDLRAFARKDPKRYFASGSDHKAAFKMIIMDLMDWGLVELDTTKREFVVTVTDEKIFRWAHGVTEDPVDGLANYCINDERGREIFQAIKNMGEYWVQ